jgi:hypothetical protein
MKPVISERVTSQHLPERTLNISKMMDAAQMNVMSLPADTDSLLHYSRTLQLQFT